ncbi:MAG: pilus assembly protein TadG-related protein [Desulfobaccales bacterium]
MTKKFWKNQRGSMAVLVGVMLPVLVGFLGLALDFGHVILVRTQMQNAVDAAACAGAMKLTVPIPGGQSQATTEANSMITANSFSTANAAVTFPTDPQNNPSGAPLVKVSLTDSVPTYFMRVLGIKTVSLKAHAEAIRESSLESYPGGPFNYTIFSNTSLIINGTDKITGSVHCNASLTLNGDLTITEKSEGYTQVIVNGDNDLGSVGAGTLSEISVNGTNTIGSKYGGVTDIAMPNYTQQILATIPSTNQYSSSQTFNGANISIDGGIYVNGNVIINGEINGSGPILATGSIIVNGVSTISGSNQVFLYSSGSSITINGNNGFGSGTTSVICYAPSSNGSIIVNGVNVINGDVIGNSITINGGEDIDGMLNNSVYPITSIDLGEHAKLIN